MPNYIKNRIELAGNKAKVKMFIHAFSTHYEESQHKSFVGDDTYKNEKGELGWLNVKTNVFTTRGGHTFSSIPDGFKPLKEKAWTRFPDFEKIVPMDESLNIPSGRWTMPLDNKFSHNVTFKNHVDELKRFCESQPDQKEELVGNLFKAISNYIDYGHSTRYSWRIENWGVKWNASDCEKISETTFDFTTAWSGVPKMIEKMSLKFPSVKIKYKYSDEDTGCNCGVGTYLGGEVSFSRLENSSTEAYELAFELRPDRKDCFVLVGGAYQYVSED